MLQYVARRSRVHARLVQLAKHSNSKLLVGKYLSSALLQPSFNVLDHSLASFKVKLTDKEHFVSKCYLPPESAVISNYVATGLFLALYLAVTAIYRFRVLNAKLKTFVGRTISRKLH